MSTLVLRNCEFAYRCPAKWEDLPQTAITKVSFCLDCGKTVHRCDTDAELLRAIKLNHCVATVQEDQEDVSGYRFLAGVPRLKD